MVNNNEVKTPIPARLYNATVGGHVCGTEDVFDDESGKTQKEINATINQITVDSELSSSSENPVQNKVVKAALDLKANSSAIPTVPTISTNISEDANSDTKTASPKAVKTYADGKASEVSASVNDAINQQNTVINQRMASQDEAIARLSSLGATSVDSVPAAANAEAGVFYCVPGTNSYTIYMKDTTVTPNVMKPLATYTFPGEDDKPTPGSDNFVKSKGIAAIGLSDDLVEGVAAARLDASGNITTTQSGSSGRKVTPMFTPIDRTLAITFTTADGEGFWCYDNDMKPLVQYTTKTGDTYSAIIGVDIPAETRHIRATYLKNNPYTTSNLKIVDINDVIDDINDKTSEIDEAITDDEVYASIGISRIDGTLASSGVALINATNFMRIVDINSNIEITNVRCSAKWAGYAFYDKYRQYLGCDSGLATNVNIPSVVITPQQIPYGAVYIRVSHASLVNRNYKNIIFENAVDRVSALEQITMISDNEQLPYIRPLALIGSIAGKNSNANPTILTMAHISDIHLDYDVSKRFFDVVNSHSIDMGIITGDLFQGEQTEGDYGTFAQFSQYFSDSPKSLLCVGNHDAGAMAHDIGNCNSLVYDKMFAPWADRYPNMLVGHNCYYVDKVAAGGTVRVIVLNEFDFPDDFTGSKLRCVFSQAQIDWFINVLEDAARNNYFVVCAEHTIMSSDLVTTNTAWNMQGVNPASINYFKGTPIIDIIEAWKNGGSVNNSYPAIVQETPVAGLPTISVNHTFATAGKFICHINGHGHIDKIGVYANTTQLCINITMGNAFRYENDLPRTRVDYTIDAFNLYAFDLENSLIHVVRYGADYPVTGILRHYGKFKF